MSKYGGYEDNEFVAEFYDIVYQNARKKDVKFFVDFSIKSGGRTLELGCGTGRVLIPTAAAGCKITGLDLSPFMLKKCREKLAKEPVELQQRVKLVQGKMTGFATGEKYTLITIPFRPFQHLITVEEQKACLNCIDKHLEPHGLCIIDVFNPDLARLVTNPKYTVEVEEVPEIELPDGRTERLVQSFPMRYYFKYEIQHLLELCGFRVVELFGDFDKSAFSDDSPEMIFVAEKN